MNVCLVLGAGASLANALHFRPVQKKDLRPPLDTTFFETVDARKVALSAALRNYFPTFLGISGSSANLRGLRMEEVFSDVFFDFQEDRGNTAALDAYIDLVDLYLRVIRETTNWLCEHSRSGGPIGKLLANAAAVADKVTVITFNHDLVIENEILRRPRLRARWCLDEGYGSISGRLKPVNPAAGSPVFPVHKDSLCDHDRPITLLKLHGSLNWNVKINSSKPTAHRLLSGASGDLDLVTSRQVLSRSVYVRSAVGRGRTRWTMWPVVVPPVYGKQTLRGETLNASWEDARAALLEADRIAIYGYSLPQLDIDAEKLFERGLARNTALDWIDVLNPAPVSAARFGGIASRKPLRWFPSADDFLSAGAFS